MKSNNYQFAKRKLNEEKVTDDEKVKNRKIDKNEIDDKKYEIDESLSEFSPSFSSSPPSSSFSSLSPSSPPSSVLLSSLSSSPPLLFSPSFSKEKSILLRLPKELQNQIATLTIATLLNKPLTDPGVLNLVRKNKLPGPLPVSLSRVAIRKYLKTSPYWFCEKTDGNRNMLLIADNITSGPRAWLIDRALEIKQLDWVSEFCSKFCGKSIGGDIGGDIGEIKCTLFDAELVEDRDGPEKIFIFDTVAFCGKRVAEEKFSVRRGYLKKFEIALNEYYNEEEKMANSRESNEEDKQERVEMAALKFSPRVHCKKYFLADADGRSIRDLFNMIKFDRATGKWYYHDPSRGVSPNDGIIFVPENDDYFCRVLRLLKWKMISEISIDFKIKKPFFNTISNGTEINLYCSAKAEGERDYHDLLVTSTEVRDEDAKELKRRIASGEIKDSAIVECRFEKKEGMWRIVKYRLDKTEANVVTTAFATLMNIVEDITKEEIVEVMTSAPKLKS